jgi:hypothetical protein
MIPSLTGVHFLITYGCSAKCAHCFVWGSPDRTAAMTAEQVDDFLDEIVALNQITDVCADGGEPFEEYDVFLHFLRRAMALGLSASALTNASWVESREQATERIAELMAGGLGNLGISTDQWHREDVPVERVDLLLDVCEEAGLGTARMETTPEGVMFRGRAAETLAADMPTRPPESFTKCPHESLGAPGRIHLDCYGFLHLCQGITLGRASIADAIGGFDAQRHPIVQLLLEGGPYALGRFAVERGFELSPGYVDACHLCYRAREFLRGDFPDLLAPDEMYGP